jgi:hypothetical protein
LAGTGRDNIVWLLPYSLEMTTYNFSENSESGLMHLYVRGITYPCGYYERGERQVKAASYIFPPGCGVSTNNKTEYFSNEKDAQAYLVRLLISNCRQYYPQYTGPFLNPFNHDQPRIS